jgi:hypothetical protein
MKAIVKIGDVELTPVEYRGERVMTLAMMDVVHKRAEGTARRNFNENKVRLIEGEDFSKVSANEIRTHKICAISKKSHEDMILLTETGYSMLVKSFTDDLAWDVQRQLVRSYFAKRVEPAHQTQEHALVRKDSKSSNRVMNGVVEMVREDQGKTCAHYHYSNEVLMLYEILFGERKAVNRDELSVEDLSKLIKLETRNAILIAAGLSFSDRKEKLREYAKKLATTVPMLKSTKERRA